MVLTKSEILKAIETERIIINPFRKKSLTINSYDIHLGETIGIYKNNLLDVKKKNDLEYFKLPKDGYILYPNQFYLGVTEEYIESQEFVPFLEGKSSIARLGITIHITAGKGDIGYGNHWTLEIFVLQPVRIYSFMPIGQIIFFKAFGEIDKTNIQGKYSLKTNLPIPSKSYLDFENEKSENKEKN